MFKIIGDRSKLNYVVENDEFKKKSVYICEILGQKSVKVMLIYWDSVREIH